MAIQGILEIDDNSDRGVPYTDRKRYWDDVVHKVYPKGIGAKGKISMAAITTLKRRVGGGDSALTDIEFNWWEEKWRSFRYRVGKPTDNDTAESPISGNYLYLYDLNKVNDVKIRQGLLQEMGESINQEGYGAGTLHRGDLLSVDATGEILRVTSEPTADDLRMNRVPVTRDIGGSKPSTNDLMVVRNKVANGGNFTCAFTSGTALTSTATVQSSASPFVSFMGSAFGEISKVPGSDYWRAQRRWNCIGIQRGSYAISRQDQLTKFTTGSKLANEKRRHMEKFMIGLEKYLWFSRRDINVENAEASEGKIRMGDGIFAQIPQSQTISAAEETGRIRSQTGQDGVVDLDWLEDVLYRISNGVGSDERMCFCGGRFLMALQKTMRKNSEFQADMETGVKEYGFNVTKLHSNGMTLTFVRHPLFDRQQGGILSQTGTSSDTWSNLTYTDLSSSCVLLDMMNIEHVYLKGGIPNVRIDHYQKHLMNTNEAEDADRWSMTAECGLKMMNVETHWRINGLIYGGKDQS